MFILTQVQTRNSKMTKFDFKPFEMRTYQFSFDQRKGKTSPCVNQIKKIHTGESRMPYTVVVEGNVGAGKSTFVEILAREDARISPVPEPVSAWQNVSGTGVNLLGMSS